MQALDEMQQIIAGMAESAGRSVVGVSRMGASGSGFVVGGGRVLTNAHNVRGENVSVTFAGGRSAEGRALAIDVEGDLAVLDVEATDLPAVDLEAGGTPGLGQVVFALSNAGGRGLRITMGTVSGLQRSFRGPRGRRIEGGVEHTAPLPPGSSGSPIFDASGRLLGINTHRLGEGFYLAIPADEAFRIRVGELVEGRSPRSVRLGVALAPPHVAGRLRRAVGLPDVEGLLVRNVEEGSAAEQAGLEKGDLLTHAGGKPLVSVDGLFAALDGSPLELMVMRGTDPVTVVVEFGE